MCNLFLHMACFQQINQKICDKIRYDNYVELNEYIELMQRRKK